MERFITLLSFLTRIPVKTSGKLDEAFHKSAKYFSLVGIVLGIFYLIFGVATSKIFGAHIGALVFISTNIILTGGLHLDGLGDTFDGLYSYRDKDRILEIMKDSRLGTNALLAILILILFKIALADKFISQGYYYGLFFMPVMGKMASVLACYKGKTAKKNGMGNAFIGKVSAIDFYIALGIGILAMVLPSIIIKDYSIAIINVTVVIIVSLLTLGYMNHVYKIIDGLTGDILGAICELAEVVYLFMYYLGVTLWQLFI